MNKPELARASDIRPDFSRAITDKNKQSLVELVHSEFHSQRSKFDQQVSLEKSKLLESHRKTAGFERLLKGIETATEELRALKAAKTKELEAFDAKQAIVMERLGKERTAFRKGQDAAIGLSRKKKDRADDALFNKGFRTNGHLIDVSDYATGNITRELKTKVRDIQQEMEDIKNAIYPAENQRNKYVALLLACTTYGEAMVVLREVLGNDIIPSVLKTDLPYKQLENKG